LCCRLVFPGPQGVFMQGLVGIGHCRQARPIIECCVLPPRGPKLCGGRGRSWATSFWPRSSGKHGWAWHFASRDRQTRSSPWFLGRPRHKTLRTNSRPANRAGNRKPRAWARVSAISAKMTCSAERHPAKARASRAGYAMGTMVLGHRGPPASVTFRS